MPLAPLCVPKAARLAAGAPRAATLRIHGTGGVHGLRRHAHTPRAPRSAIAIISRATAAAGNISRPVAAREHLPYGRNACAYLPHGYGAREHLLHSLGAREYLLRGHGRREHLLHGRGRREHLLLGHGALVRLPHGRDARDNLRTVAHPSCKYRRGARASAARAYSSRSSVGARDYLPRDGGRREHLAPSRGARAPPTRPPRVP